LDYRERSPDAIYENKEERCGEPVRVLIHRMDKEGSDDYLGTKPQLTMTRLRYIMPDSDGQLHPRSRLNSVSYCLNA
jgi:hypothetical protein